MASDIKAILAGLYGSKTAIIRQSVEASNPPEIVKARKFCGWPEHFVVMPNDFIVILCSRFSWLQTSAWPISCTYPIGIVNTRNSPIA